VLKPILRMFGEPKLYDSRLDPPGQGNAVNETHGLRRALRARLGGLQVPVTQAYRAVRGFLDRDDVVRLWLAFFPRVARNERLWHAGFLSKFKLSCFSFLQPRLQLHVSYTSCHMTSVNHFV
jgi:hypothetical protein